MNHFGSIATILWNRADNRGWHETSFIDDRWRKRSAGGFDCDA
jgi:hypothetical protein